MSPVRSVYWKHFVKKSKNEVICKYCKKTIKHCGNTSNLKSHYEKMHLSYLNAMKLTIPEVIVSAGSNDLNIEKVYSLQQAPTAEEAMKKELESDTENGDIHTLENDQEYFIYPGSESSSKEGQSPKIKLHKDFLPLPVKRKKIDVIESIELLDDELRAFTESLFHRLRKIENRNARKACIIKHQFEDLLFKAEMEIYDNEEANPPQSTSAN